MSPSPDTPQARRAASLRRENDELRRELERVRASRSYRLARGLARVAAAVRPGRRAPRRPPADARPAPTAERATGTPGGAAGLGPSSGDIIPSLAHVALAADVVGPRTPDDLLVDARRMRAQDLAANAARWREGLPDHARLLVAHAAAGWSGGDRVVEVPDDIDLAAAKARFGPHRRATATREGGIELPPARPPVRPQVRALRGEPERAAGIPDGPVFVGGTGRSGTWVVGRMLRHHPDWITVHTELRFHAVPGGFRAVLAGTTSPERFAEKVRRKWFGISGGSGNPKGLQMILAHHELQGGLKRFLRTAEDDVPAALGELLLEIVERYARGRGALGWTETTPYNASAAHALLTALPNARLVHTIRDGRDVASSVTSMPWGPDTMEEALDWWAERVLQASHGVSAADPARVHSLRLEELIHLEREDSYTRLLEFLGFDDEPRVRRYFDEQIDSRRGNVGRWRKQVDAASRDRIDGRYRDLLEELRERGMDVLPTEPERVDELAGR